MRNIILLFCIIMHMQVDGMKRLCTFTNTRPTKKICQLSKKQFMPTDILCLILKSCAYNQGKLKTIAMTLRAFGLANKALYSYYNNTIVFNELMDLICNAHYCSHESITKFLCPVVAHEQIRAQSDLKKLLLTETLVSEELFNGFNETITELLQKGARLDFTYNYKLEPHTPLMMAQSNKTFQFLLNSGSSINETASRGITVLMRAAQFPIIGKHVKRIIKNEKLDINQTNHRGETALLRCIKNREKHNVSEVFRETIKRLLKNGADPLHVDKDGWTPLLRAKKLGYPIYRKNEVIQLIDDAIAKKSPPSSEFLN